MPSSPVVITEWGFSVVLRGLICGCALALRREIGIQQHPQQHGYARINTFKWCELVAIGLHVWKMSSKWSPDCRSRAKRPAAPHLHPPSGCAIKGTICSQQTAFIRSIWEVARKYALNSVIKREKSAAGSHCSVKSRTRGQNKRLWNLQNLVELPYWFVHVMAWSSRSISGRIHPRRRTQTDRLQLQPPFG